MNEQEQRVREFYQSVELPAERLEQLIQSTHGPEEASNNQLASDRWLQRQWKKLISLASTPTFRALAATGAVALVSLWMYNSGTDSESTMRTLREVAMNHSTRLEPEYMGESLAMLDDSMQKLPFALVLPQDVKKKYVLVGSRYCSLGGVLAAHVKFHDRESGKPVSLFVTHNAAELNKINAQQSTIEGVEVELWREDGLFYALAQRS